MQQWTAVIVVVLSSPSLRGSTTAETVAKSSVLGKSVIQCVCVVCVLCVCMRACMCTCACMRACMCTCACMCASPSFVICGHFCRCSNFESEVERLRIHKKVRVCFPCYSKHSSPEKTKLFRAPSDIDV